MKNLIFPALLIVFCCFFACQKDAGQKPVAAQQETDQYFAPFDVDGVTSRNACDWVTIPAGSTNVLQQAIDNICDGGIIYLLAGMHLEHARVTVNKPVKIIGEDGAVLKIESAPIAPWDADLNMTTVPALHLLNAPHTLVQNIEIIPMTPDGHTAILIENSERSAVMKCKISNFQFGLIVHKSDRMTIMYNTIASSLAWTTGQVEEAFGIMMISGKSCYLGHNEITNSFLGVWVCDNWGTCDQNNFHDNYIGLILCFVPPYVILPNGEKVGAPNSSYGWKIRNNKANHNLDAGILVIDGANNNHLINNEAYHNGTYGIELAGESFRFGYLTPTSHDNKVNVGSYNDILIKVCGDNNAVNGGGNMVDTSVDICN